MYDSLSAPPFGAPLPPPNHAADIRDLSQPLASGTGWMKLVGIVSIIQGVLMCMTLIYAIVGWLPIWMGSLVLKSCSALERAQASGDPAALKEALDKLRTYFVIQGVLILVSIAFVVLVLLIFGAAMIAALKNGAFNHLNHA